MSKVLVILPNNPGDVLMATPAVRALARKHQVHFLVDAECEELVRCNPHLARVHVVPRRALKEALKNTANETGWLTLQALAEELRQQAFDRVINLFQGDLYAYLAAFLGCPDTTGATVTPSGIRQVNGPALRVLASLPFDRRHLPAHAGDIYTLAAGELPDGKPAELALAPETILSLQRKLNGRLDRGRPAVAVHPFSAHRKKQWPPAFFRELIQELDRRGYAVWVTGAPEEAGPAAELVRGTAALPAAGLLTLLECGALYRQCQAVVAGDTVALHLAAATGTRAVGLFGPTHPAETGPLGPGHILFHASCHCLGQYTGGCLVEKPCQALVPAAAVADAVMGLVPPAIPGVEIFQTRYRESGFLDLCDSRGQSAYSPAALAWLLQACGQPVPPEINRRCILPRHFSRLREVTARRQRNLQELLRRLTARQPAPELLATEKALDREARVHVDEFSQMVNQYSVLALDSIDETDPLRLLMRIGQELQRFAALLEALPYPPAGALPAGPLVSIVITVRDQLALTRECLESVFHFLDYSPYEVIVVDNASGPETADYLSGLGDRITLLSNPQNRTFSQANNQGARVGRGENFLFLNNDTVVSPAFLDYLVGALRLFPRAGAAGARLLYEDLSVQHAGVAFTREKSPYHIFEGERRFDPRVMKPRFCQSLTAACLLVSREAFQAVSGFDEEYDYGFEDVDLCLKLREAGYQLVYEPRAEVIHRARRTRGPLDEEREKKNGLVLGRKWYHKIVPDEEEVRGKVEG